MLLAIGIILFAIGCLVSAVDDASYKAQKREEELMRVLYKHRNDPPDVKQTKVTRRRIARDKEGNVLAEEITEEII